MFAIFSKMPSVQLPAMLILVSNALCVVVDLTKMQLRSKRGFAYVLVGT